MTLKTSRAYPVNVKTKEIYIGKYHGDWREGFPSVSKGLEHWYGQPDMTVLYGKHLSNLSKVGYRFIGRSIYPNERRIA